MATVAREPPCMLPDIEQKMLVGREGTQQGVQARVQMQKGGGRKKGSQKQHGEETNWKKEKKTQRTILMVMTAEGGKTTRRLNKMQKNKKKKEQKIKGVGKGKKELMAVGVPKIAQTKTEIAQGRRRPS